MRPKMAETRPEIGEDEARDGRDEAQDGPRTAEPRPGTAKTRPETAKARPETAKMRGGMAKMRPSMAKTRSETGKMIFVLEKVPFSVADCRGATSTDVVRYIHRPRRFWTRVEPKMGPSWLQVGPRWPLRRLEERAFRVGGVSKMRVSGRDWGAEETKLRAEIT